MQTRFDPLHVAETEQRLYVGLADLLPGMARRALSSEASFEIRLRGGG